MYSFWSKSSNWTRDENCFGKVFAFELALTYYNNNSLNALKFALHTWMFSLFFSFSDLFVAKLEPMFAMTGSVFNRGGINATVDSNRGSKAKQDSLGSNHLLKNITIFRIWPREMWTSLYFSPENSNHPTQPS